jgi:hypothetical protein
MNTSTQPSEGAGGSRSRAAGELTLGLMSGEEHGRTPINCRSWLASDGGLTATQSLSDVPNPCAGLPAKTDCKPTNPSQMYPIQLWERACSRRGRHIQKRCWLTHRYREQARSRRIPCRLVALGPPANRARTFNFSSSGPGTIEFCPGGSTPVVFAFDVRCAGALPCLNSIAASQPIPGLRRW